MRLILIVRRFFGKVDNNFNFSNSKTLIISCSGIGNTVMSIPFIATITKNIGNGTVDVLTNSEASKVVLLNSVQDINNIFIYKRTLIEKIKVLYVLRKKKYRYCLLAFPTLLLSIELIPWFINVKHSISHDYKSIQKYFKYIEKLFSNTIQIENGIHDIEQNLNLLSLFSVTNYLHKYPSPNISEQSNQFVKRYLEKLKNDKSKKMIAIHPGSKRGTDYKRWPLQNFLALAKTLKNELAADVFFILGPEEREFRGNIIENNLLFIQTDHIENIMAFLDRCSLLVCNDSGIMHIASLINIPIVTIWGGTNEKRNGPRASNVYNLVNKNVSCRPCVNFTYVPCSNKNHQCILDMSVDQAYQEIIKWYNQI